uniref:DUF7356 domain-containing protein n=1 Tax=Kalanchoe fedtschenkoi TaxID=63787 RepID=A0A7N0UES7_KALFE
MRLATSPGRLILRLLVLSLILSQTSCAAPGPTGNSVKISPSPSPNPSAVISTDGSSDGLAKEKAVGSLTDDRCEATPYSCHQKNLTACVQFAEKIPVEASMLVQNGGEGTLSVNASISPNNLNFTNILLLKSQARKVDVSAILRGNQEISLTSGNESCVIHIGLSVPAGPAAEGSFFQKLPYADQVTPIHGAILFSVTLIIVGGIWACCKSHTSERQGDGIPYQELEMGQSNSIEEGGGGGWDEVWDDNWDDDQESIKSPAQDHHQLTVFTPGHPLKKDGTKIGKTS